MVATAVVSVQRAVAGRNHAIVPVGISVVCVHVHPHFFVRSDDWNSIGVTVVPRNEIKRFPAVYIVALDIISRIGSWNGLERCSALRYHLRPHHRILTILVVSGVRIIIVGGMISARRHSDPVITATPRCVVHNLFLVWFILASGSTHWPRERRRSLVPLETMLALPEARWLTPAHHLWLATHLTKLMGQMIH